MADLKEEKILNSVWMNACKNKVLLFNKTQFGNYFIELLKDEYFLENLLNNIQISSFEEFLLIIEKCFKQKGILCAIDNKGELERIYFKVQTRISSTKKLQQARNLISDLEIGAKGYEDRIKQIKEIKVMLSDIAEEPTLKEEIEKHLTYIENKRVEFNQRKSYDVTDADYLNQLDDIFVHRNEVWTSRFGSYHNNLYFEPNKKICDQEPKLLCECNMLDNVPENTKDYFHPTNRIFTPLCFKNFICLSEDGKSISIFDSTYNETAKGFKKLIRIELNSPILSTGAMIFLNNTFYLVVCCKNGIYVLNHREIVKYFPVDFTNTNIQIKAMKSFNKLAIILVETKDKSYIYTIKQSFDKNNNITFIYKMLEVENKVVGDILIYFNKNILISYFTNKFEFVTLNENLQKINLENVDLLPEEGKRYMPPITLYQNENIINIYYLAFDNRKKQYLCILNVTNINNVQWRQIKIDVEIKRNLGFSFDDGDFTSHFTNLVFYNNKIGVCNFDDSVKEYNIYSQNLGQDEVCECIASKSNYKENVYRNILLQFKDYQTKDDAYFIFKDTALKNYRILSMSNFRPIVIYNEKESQTKYSLYIMTK